MSSFLRSPSNSYKTTRQASTVTSSRAISTTGDRICAIWGRASIALYVSYNPQEGTSANASQNVRDRRLGPLPLLAPPGFG